MAPGVLRLQLPIQMPGLGHVNCYVLPDDNGVAVTYQRLKGIQPEKLPRLGVEYARTIYSSLKAAGVNMVVYLPDSSNYPKRSRNRRKCWRSRLRSRVHCCAWSASRRTAIGHCC